MSLQNKLYKKGIDLQGLEPYYTRHVEAMTSEELHFKSDIAAELAWRDKQIAELKEKVEEYERKIIEHNKLMDGTYE